MEGRTDVQSLGEGDETAEAADGRATERGQQQTAGTEAAEHLLGADVVSLGMRIIAELGGDDAPLLAQWMAFRIAELMRQIEEADEASARENAAQACADLVLRVWDERSSWPRGWPPHSAQQVVTALQERSQWQRAPVPDQDEEFSWWSVLPAALDSLTEEQKLWRLVALADTDPSDIQAWLDQPGAELRDDEEDLLENIAQAIERAPDQLALLLGANDRTRARQLNDQDADLTAERRDQLSLRRMKDLTRSRTRLASRVADGRTT